MTDIEAAEWMLSRFEHAGFLYQEEAATHLMQLGLARLAYFDANSSLCIGKGVLKAFEELTPEAVYERRDRFWRPRLPTDQSGRMQ